MARDESTPQDWLMTAIAEAQKLLQESSIMPSSDELRRYIEGTASEDERRRVTKAMTESTRLQRLVLQLTEEYDRLRDDQLNLEIVAHRERNVPRWVTAAAPPGGAPPARTTLWHVLSSVAAILLISFILLPQYLNDGLDVAGMAQLTLVDESVGSDALLSGVTRGPQYAGDSLFTTAREAALHAFGSMLELGEEGFRIDPDFHYRPASESLEMINLKIYSPSGNRIAEQSIFLPRSYSRSSARLWILLLPERQLWQANLNSSTLDLVLPASGIGQGITATTVATPDGFLSWPGSSFATE